MSRILVIGCGKPQRRDDGLGQVAVQHIERLVQDQAVKAIVRHQRGIELAEDLRDADLAIFIDAHVGDEPSTLKETEVVPDNAVPGAYSHNLSPSVLLGCVEETVAYSIAADSFNYGVGLSSSVEATLPVLIDRVLARIAAFKISKDMGYPRLYTLHVDPGYYTVKLVRRQPVELYKGWV